MGPPVFVVLAHKAPAQVGRLARRLAPFPVLVHVDARVPSAVWQEFPAIAASCSNIEFLPRHRSPWASWGLVAAALEGVRQALTKDCSHVVLTTGQDYLLQPVGQVAEFFASYPDRSWMGHMKAPVWYIEDKDGGMSRTTYWNWPLMGRRARVPGNRRPPAGVDLYFGQAQFVMARPVAQWVTDQVDRRPEIVKFFRWAWAPDEWFFHSMAASSPMAEEVSGSCLWYADWSAGGRHPRVFTSSDAPTLLAVARGEVPDLSGGQDKLFARKFNFEVSAELLGTLDRELLQQHS